MILFLIYLIWSLIGAVYLTMTDDEKDETVEQVICAPFWVTCVLVGMLRNLFVSKID